MAIAVRTAAGVLIGACILGAQPRAIDVQKSRITVRVFKTGLFSALGHDHEIAASIADGFVDIDNRRVQLRCNATDLRVRDPDVSDSDREKIQQTMLGPDVLAVDRYAQIVFESSAAQPLGAGVWMVSGELTLHGQVKPITLRTSERDGHYFGTVRIKQSKFGIKPIKVAGGTVKVKDEVEVEFEVQLAHPARK